MPMRDIRDDLRERLKAADARLDDEKERYSAERNRVEAEHARNVEAIHEQRRALITILNAENEATGSPAEPEFQARNMRLPLKDHFITYVHTYGPQTKDDLKDAATRAGYFDEDSSGGRTAHAILMNLTTSGKLIRLPDGRYAAPNYSGGEEMNEAPTGSPVEAFVS